MGRVCEVPTSPTFCFTPMFTGSPNGSSASRPQLGPADVHRSRTSVTVCLICPPSRSRTPPHAAPCRSRLTIHCSPMLEGRKVGRRKPARRNGPHVSRLWRRLLRAGQLPAADHVSSPICASRYRSALRVRPVPPMRCKAPPKGRAPGGDSRAFPISRFHDRERRPSLSV